MTATPPAIQKVADQLTAQPLTGNYTDSSSKPVFLIGWLTILWGDPQSSDTGAAGPVYRLMDEAGNSTVLDVRALQNPSTGNLLSFNGHRVVVEGAWHPAERVDPSAPIEFLAGRITLENENFQSALPDSVIGSQPWVSVMCKFSDVSTEPKPLTYFNNMYVNSYPGLDHYWREVSYNKVNLAGSSARGWYLLPKPRS